MEANKEPATDTPEELGLEPGLEPTESLITLPATCGTCNFCRPEAPHDPESKVHVCQCGPATTIMQPIQNTLTGEVRMSKNGFYPDVSLDAPACGQHAPIVVGEPDAEPLTCETCEHCKHPAANPDLSRRECLCGPPTACIMQRKNVITDQVQISMEAHYPPTNVATIACGQHKPKL